MAGKNVIQNTSSGVCGHALEIVAGERGRADEVDRIEQHRPDLDKLVDRALNGVEALAVRDQEHQQAVVVRPPFADLLAAMEDRSEEHTSELQSLMRISYAVFCLKKK